MAKYKRIDIELLNCQKPKPSVFNTIRSGENTYSYDYRKNKVKGVYAILNENQEIIYIGQTKDMYRGYLRYRSPKECAARMSDRPIYGWLLKQFNNGKKVYFTYVQTRTIKDMFKLEEKEVILNNPPYNQTDDGSGKRPLKERK